MSLPIMTGTGRLIEDPELRFTPSGKAVAKVRLAFNSRKKNPQTQEWEDDKAFFINGTVWGQEAENLAESLQRGVEVVVTGRLETRSYETREGEKRSVVELQVDSIGPTLKFATAKLQRMSRSSGGGRASGGSGGGGFDDPWASSSSATPAGSAASDFDSEPPF
ncbi:single-stranded DNA-binding protein [Micromonospora sp. CPCC 205371]|nr:single-stranded DNA-binding protein [Micromonospora sp. CPCC 205371]